MAYKGNPDSGSCLRPPWIATLALAADCVYGAFHCSDGVRGRFDPLTNVSLSSNGLYGSAEAFERFGGVSVLDLLLLVENTVATPQKRGR